MKRRMALGSLLAATAWVAGCSTASKTTDLAAAWPELRPGYGRVVFFRSSGFFGAAISGGISLDGEMVGVSNPGKYFFVDRPAGKHVAKAATEVVNTVNFTLTEGETKFLRASPTMGLSSGRLSLELEEPKKAMDEVATLSHSGRMGR